MEDDKDPAEGDEMSDSLGEVAFPVVFLLFACVGLAIGVVIAKGIRQRDRGRRRRGRQDREDDGDEPLMTEVNF
jgi:hypothetical protein